MTPSRALLLALIQPQKRAKHLARALTSFREGLFATFPVAGVYANIDLIFGDAADHAACRAAILTTFPDAVISEPATAGFGKAVRTLWAATRSAFVFHLEDDWVLNEPLRPEQVFPLLSGDTKALAPVSKELGWDGRSTFNVRRRKVRILGIPVGHRTVNIFGTSPRFLEGEFARACAALMDPDLDPEKQMRPPSNPALRAYMQGFRCRFLPARAHPELISDIGRSWRDARGIDKVVAGGVSTWTPRA